MSRKIDMGKILEEEILKVFSELHSDSELKNANITVRRDYKDYIIVLRENKVLFQGKLLDDKEMD